MFYLLFDVVDDLLKHNIRKTLLIFERKKHTHTQYHEKKLKKKRLFKVKENNRRKKKSQAKKPMTYMNIIK